MNMYTILDKNRGKMVEKENSGAPRVYHRRIDALSAARQLARLYWGTEGAPTTCWTKMSREDQDAFRDKMFTVVEYEVQVQPHD